MSEFKFFCPDCGQHIACDEAYAGRQTQCPACHGALVVPRPPREVHRLRIAPASPHPLRPHPLYPVPTSADPWTEEAWDKHVAELEKKHRPQLSPWVRALVVLLLISPSIAALGTAAWGKNLDAGAEVLGLFILLFLFAIAVAALASYVFEGSSQGYLDEGWDPGDGVNALLLLLGGLTLLLGDYPYWRWSWGSRGPWSWTRVWIGVISTVNFLAIFLCWLTVAVG